MKRSDRLPRFRSIQVAMAFAYSVLSVVMIVGAVLISYSVTEEAARSSSRRYTQQLVVQIAGNIESYIEYMDSVSAFVQSNLDVQAFLRERDSEARTAIAQRAEKALGAIVRSRKDISLVSVFGYDGSFLAHDPAVLKNPNADPARLGWFIQARANGGKPAISSSHVQNVVQDSYRWVISLSREVIDQTTNQGAGVLLVDLNFEVIDRICGSVSLGKRGYIFIVDGEGNIVYHPRQQLIYGGLKTENIQQIIASRDEYLSIKDADGDKLYSVRTMGTTGWKIVGVNYEDELVANRESIRLTYTAWGLGFFVMTIILSIVLAKRISEPLMRLRRSMQAVELGNFDIRVDIQSSDEIGELGKDFNIMIAEIRELIRENSEQQELKRKSELKALQLQINPHFLYNTLDSVIWMAEGGKEQEVITMVSALARLFRLSISKGKEIIDIRSEVEHVGHYLTIQKIRYKDKLDYSIAVDPDILGCRTVKIILQPLVENAIYHGIKNKPSPGKVTIRGSRTVKGLELLVIDDGIGMTAEAITRALSRTATDPDTDTESSGLGVRNVDERIKLYFGPEYGLDFESSPETGTTVRVRLPAIEGDFPS